MLRLFTGLDLDPTLAGQLAATAGGLPGARWVAARNLHLTLAFIGEVDRPTAEEIAHELAGIEAAAFRIRLAGWGLFGSRRQAHTLWRGIEPSEPLARLAAQVAQALRRAGHPPEARRFQPHITLARLSGTPPERLHRLIEAPAPACGATIEVDALTLFESLLGHEGAEYRRLAVWPLGPEVLGSR